ncbi:MAG: hypothetical protein WCJ35_01400 [Planctomycetota bacterium]
MDYIIFNWNTIFWGVVALLLSFALGTMVLIAFVATLPPTFLQTPDTSLGSTQANPVPRWVRRIGKNLVGLLVIAIGLVLALPGVPGPGLPFVLVGLILVDFPGKQQWVRKLLSVPGVLSGINALRVRLGKPSLASPQGPANQ